MKNKHVEYEQQLLQKYTNKVQPAKERDEHPEVVRLLTEIIESDGFKQLDKKLQAIIYYDRGVAYRKSDKLENLDLAICDYSEAIRLDPEYADAYNNRGFAYRKLGKFDLAIADCNEAIFLNPHFTVAYANRANIYADKGRLEKDNHDATACFNQAMVDYSEAIRLDHNYAGAYKDLGLFLTNHRKHATGKYDHNLTIEQREVVEEGLKIPKSNWAGVALLYSYFASISDEERATPQKRDSRIRDNILRFEREVR